MATGGFQHVLFTPIDNYVHYVSGVPLVSPRLTDLVKIINNIPLENTPLKNILQILRPANENFVWTLLNSAEKNFQIEGRSENFLTFTGEEIVSVFTELSLCTYHCKQGKNGRNRKCDGTCGSLHLCRNFLLKSKEGCRFSKKNNCMFGHDFHSDHNISLLKKHNLDALSESELHTLFRRPLSRFKATTPQVCRYYNKTNCTNKHCISLHICSRFILDENHFNCNKNHSFQDEQVKKTLDLYAIDKFWSEKAVYNLVRRVHKAEQTDDSDEPNSEISDNESIHSHGSGFSSASITKPNLLGSVKSQDTCSGCKKLMEEISSIKREVSELKLEVTELKDWNESSDKEV
ncbi:Protein mono-ADP-ribosyltransferase parp12 [Bulinus truncatus]|nr:Protein mono-ADP-ribosyltransferase parp12 [Bulinus truncatus]